jgi:signal transduction histidine kinase
MRRRFWPAALAVTAVLVLGSYLLYTQQLVRQIQREAATHAQIYSIVQQGMLRVGDEGAAALALIDLQQQLGSLDVPIIAFNADGEVYAAENLPFDTDLATDEGRDRVRRYAERIAAARPGHRTAVPGAGAIVFGDPPLLTRLRWVPFLQVGAGVLLVGLGLAMTRAHVRAHREHLWSAMARELAHQMATPLSSLAGWVEVLQLSEGDRERMVSSGRLVQMLQTDVDRLERVSRRFERIGQPQALEQTTVRAVVDELVCYFVPRLPHLARGIRLRARVDRGLPRIMADRVLLLWALENIVKNAVDALAGRGGRITIVARRGPPARRLGRAQSTVRITIADDGPGIAPAARDRIFEPGFTTKGTGWGVGLSLSRRIVEELHHGRIMVEQRSAGGTAFNVVLPVART